MNKNLKEECCIILFAWCIMIGLIALIFLILDLFIGEVFLKFMFPFLVSITIVCLFLVLIEFITYLYMKIKIKRSE